MDTSALADLLFPQLAQNSDTTADLEEKYPPRVLPESARVTRMAPSPTGFMHLGNLFGALCDERLAHQSGGVFYLRIEDTDAKREVPGGVETILDVFHEYGLPFDEGVALESLVAAAGGSGQLDPAAVGAVFVSRGAYGPYRQRQRAAIYHVCARQLVLEGKAYPCFLTEAELAGIRETQAAQKLNFGCYGAFAKYRSTPLEEVKRLMDSGLPWVLRYRSEGSAQNRVKVTDLVRGTLELPENDQDVVLLKADGIPTYHFAHVVDDHFMRTTVVVRGEEWLATLPVHVQLFAAMGWKPPKYLHTAHLMKMENGGKRKLSKRKDPELALSFYSEQGYPVPAVTEYLMTLLNSNFEDWRKANADAPLACFPFSHKKMGTSGALFDMDKLNDVSKTVISRMTARQVLNALLPWAQKYDPAFAALLARDEAFALAMLAVGRGGPKPRKDLTVWCEAKDCFSFYFDELFAPDYTLPQSVPAGVAAQMLAEYEAMVDAQDDSGAFFEKVKQLARAHGYADDMKAYKQEPDKYPGSVADVSMVLRLAIAGRPQSPDLAAVAQVLGADMVRRRLAAMRGALVQG